MSDIKYFPRIFIGDSSKSLEMKLNEGWFNQTLVIQLNFSDSIKITLEYDVWTKNDISTKRNKNILKINFYKNLIKNMKKSLLGKQVFNESLESLNWIQHRNTVKSAIWNTFGTKKKQFHLVMCFNLSESI